MNSVTDKNNIIYFIHIIDVGSKLKGRGGVTYGHFECLYYALSLSLSLSLSPIVHFINGHRHMPGLLRTRVRVVVVLREEVHIVEDVTLIVVHLVGFQEPHVQKQRAIKGNPLLLKSMVKVISHL